MKKKYLIKTSDLSIIDRLTNCEENGLRGGTKIKIPESVTITIPPPPTPTIGQLGY